MAEKTEQPSARRLQRAAEAGDRPLSRAVVQAASLGVAVALFPALARALSHHVKDAIETLDASAPTARGLALDVLHLALPIVAATAAAALIGGLLQTGGWVGWPRKDRLEAGAEPLRDRVWQRTSELLVGLGVLAAGAWVIVDQAPSLAAVLGDGARATELFARLAMRVAWAALGAVALLAAIDLGWTRWSMRERLKMSREEVRRERREVRGDPEIRRARRRAHEELTHWASLGSLSRADLVVTDGKSTLVALVYQPERHPAPVVIVSLKGEPAERGIVDARRRSLGIERNPSLATALARVDLGEAIPRETYDAVAEALGRQR